MDSTGISSGEQSKRKGDLPPRWPSRSEAVKSTATDAFGRRAMGTIEVSVVIPTYNRKDTLRDMLEALSRQTLAREKFEVIVVVDGSTDGTWEMLQEIATPYALKPHYQENAALASAVFSSGVSVARNRGAGIARGQVLLFLDDDLLPLPELLEAHAGFHRRDPTAVVLGRLLPSDETAKKRGWNRWEERVLQNHYKLMTKGDRPPAGWRLYSATFQWAASSS